MRVYFVGSTAYGAYLSGGFDNYEEALDYQIDMNERSRLFNFHQIYFLYEATITSKDLKEIG